MAASAKGGIDMNPIRWMAARLSNYAYKAERASGLTLVANYLANILWTFDHSWQSLVRETYGRNAVVYACVRLLSQSIPEARLTAYVGEDDKREELPSSHPLRLLLKHPNELMTRFEADELTTIQMAVVGRSVWWKERANNGQVIAMWPLRPDRVGPVYSNSAEPGQRVIQGWAYLPPQAGTPILLPRQDVMAFNFPDPDGESGGIVEGFGPLSAISRQVAADNKATDHVGALLANYAQPGIALRIKGKVVNETMAELIKAKFRAEFGGTRLGTPAILDADAEIVTLGFSLADLEFPALRNNAEARICAALGVPAVLTGVLVGLEQSNQRSTVKELREFFAETTLSWYWRRYADQYTNDLAAEFGEDITCEYDTSNVRALASQKIEKLEPIKDAFVAGAVTRNQYLHALGLEPLPPAEGDVFLVPNSVAVVAATDEARRIREARQPQLSAPDRILALPAGRELTDETQTTEGQAARKAMDQMIVIPIDEDLAAALSSRSNGRGNDR